VQAGVIGNERHGRLLVARVLLRRAAGCADDALGDVAGATHRCERPPAVQGRLPEADCSRAQPAPVDVARAAAVLIFQGAVGVALAVLVALPFAHGWRDAVPLVKIGRG